MNKRPIELSWDSDLRGALAVPQRAAQHAREVARRTGTTIVVSTDGVIEHLSPDAVELRIFQASIASEAK